MKQKATALLAISFALHFWRLTEPREVVFDEVHYGKFVNAYAKTHERIFDVHPPLVKIVIAHTAKAFGLTGHFPFERIGQPYHNEPVFWLRFWPAIVGSVLALLAFGILCSLGVSEISAFIGGLLLCFENATLVQTRYLLLDGFLILGILGAIFCAIRSRKHTLIYAAGAAFFTALACQSKFTGALTCLIPLFLIGTPKKTWVRFLCVWIPAVILLYLIPWYLHFKILSLPGFGDAFSKSTGNFFRDVFFFHKEMYRANSAITTVHPDASPWWSWPLLKTPPFFWTAPSRYIYLLGNPVIWWGSLVALLTIVLRSPRFPIRQLWVLVVLYIASYVPLIPIRRPLFLYHYLPSLWLSVILIVVWLEKIGIFPKYRLLILGLTLVGFVAVLPITYGFEISPSYLSLLYFRPEFTQR